MTPSVQMPRRRHLLAAIPGLLLAGVACRSTSGAAAARPLAHVAIGASDTVGVGASVPERESWSLTDVTPLVLGHFGVPSAG